MHDKPVKGSFEAWDRLIRGAIIWAGGDDPVGGVERIREEGDTELEALRGLLLSWHEVFNSTEIVVPDLLQEIAGPFPFVKNEQIAAKMRLRDSVVAVVGGTPDTKSVGYALKRLKGRVASDLRIEAGAKSNQGRRWRVVNVKACRE